MMIDNNKRIYRAVALVLAVLLLLCSVACGGEAETTEADIPVNVPDNAPVKGLTEMETITRGTVDSDYALVCDLETLTAVAGLRATERMYPASLTKLMTFIVAYESIADRSALVEITKELKNQYPEGSRVGIDAGDFMSLNQMLYALLLESDTDAALGLALYVAGSEAAFVDRMNRKAREMGLENTNFVNVTGLHDGKHYSTAADMAAILAYVLNIELGRTILTTDTFVTYLKYYKDGVLTDYRMTFYNTTLHNRFADNGISTETPGGVLVLGGKTGFTDEAAYCLATVARAADGREYIAITGHASSSENSARDAVKLYDTYAK